MSLKQGESSILEEGMTFHIIPWMWGVDGDKTCGISDTIIITKNGCESFFRSTAISLSSLKKMLTRSVQ